jgi:T-complex protein 1 subunit delta
MPRTPPLTAPHTATLHRDTSKKRDVREMNIEAAKAVADAVRTSLGPRGMDKMVSCYLREACLFAWL